MENKFLWKADDNRKKNSNIKKFADKISKKYNIDFKDSFIELHNWSIKNPEHFWNDYWDYSQIIGNKGKQVITKHKVFYKNQFFKDSKLNFAENLLIKNNQETAIYSLKEGGLKESITWKKLCENVFKISSFFKKIGLNKNDRVAGYVPNTIETIISFLAAAKNGHIWSSCSPDFGIQGLVDRFKQIEPKVLIACDYYYYNGKKINILNRIPEILKEIPSIKRVIIFNYIEKEVSIHDYDNFKEILDTSDQDDQFERFEFNHPIYILYSSGTTGVPKCIVHGAGNALIEQKKELSIHCDVKDKDRLFILYNFKISFGIIIIIISLHIKDFKIAIILLYDEIRLNITYK